jgi:hypothetical protein
METAGSGGVPFFLNAGHPLFSYLTQNVFPQLGIYPERTRFAVRRLRRTSTVYQLTEEGSQISVIGKGSFLSARLLQRKLPWLDQEFRNLHLLREIGFDAPPHQVARPLGNLHFLRLGLFEEWKDGNSLDYYFQRAIHQQEEKPLLARLETLAFFLARLHQKTGTGRPVDWTPIAVYYQKVLGQLADDALLPGDQLQDFCRWIARWLDWLREEPVVQVLVHGDATPTNFLFPSEKELVALDLEKMKPSDRVWDLGLVCGEIKHGFLWRRRDGLGAEPFIGYFLQSYASFFDDSCQMFERICRMLPFVMAVTELRIARNRYLDLPYRLFLIQEAAACLASGCPVSGSL